MLASWRLLHTSQGVSSVSLCEYAGFDFGVCVKAYVKAHMQPRHYLNLRREVTILSEIRATRVPDVVELLDVHETPDSVLLYFRACPGGTLLHAFRTQVWTEQRLRDEVALPLARALARLHAMGTIHRDLKPENIFIDEDGAVVLGDFGLAINGAQERAVSRVGTSGFMAPEVMSQPSAEEAAFLPPGWVPSYDGKVDVWSLGALLVEAFTGQVPFAHPNHAIAALKARYQAPPQLPAGVSAECADFLRRALDPDPAKRPSAEQLLRHPWMAKAAAGAGACPFDGEWQRRLQQRLQWQRAARSAAAAAAAAAPGPAHWRQAPQAWPVQEQPPLSPCASPPPEAACCGPLLSPVAHKQQAVPSACAAPTAAPAAAAADPAVATRQLRAVFDSVDSFSAPAEPQQGCCAASKCCQAAAAAAATAPAEAGCADREERAARGHPGDNSGMSLRDKAAAAAHGCAALARGGGRGDEDDNEEGRALEPGHSSPVRAALSRALSGALSTLLCAHFDGGP